MNEGVGTLRRILGVGLVWGFLWAASLVIVCLIIGIVDPDSIDPGEGPLVTVAIFGPMGFFSGVVFGFLLSLGSKGRVVFDLSLARAVAWGILATAIVQVAYLGHGDAGLAANIKMALAFCVFGGIVSMGWLLMSRGWSHWRSSLRPSS